MMMSFSALGEFLEDPIVFSSDGEVEDTSAASDDDVEITVKRFVDRPYRSPYKTPRVSTLKPRRLIFSPPAIAPPIDKKRNRMNRRIAIYTEISNIREAFFEFTLRFNRAVKVIEDKLEEERKEDQDSNTESEGDSSEFDSEEKEAAVDRFLMTPSSDFEREYFDE